MVSAIVTALTRTLRQLSGLFIRDQKAEAGFQRETNLTGSISYLRRILFSSADGVNTCAHGDIGEFN